MAYVPDEAIVEASDISPGAWRLFGYYCMKRNKHQGGWYCPKAMVLSELPKLSEETYYRSKRELLSKGWIDRTGDFIKPVKGFMTVKNDSEQEVNPVADFDEDLHDDADGGTVKNDSPGSAEPSEYGAEMDEFSDENTVKNDSNTTKNDSNTVKNDTPATVKNDSDTVKNDSQTVKNDSAPLKESLPDITNQLNQEEKTVQKDFGIAGLSQEEKLELEMGLIFAHWQKVLNHPQSRLDEKRKAVLRSRLREGYSVETLMAVIDGVKNSPWHMGKNPDRKPYHKFDTIFRGADQIETFVELAKAKPPPEEDDPDIQIPARMSFAEIIEIAYDVNGTEATPQNYGETKAGYLGEAPSAEMIEEVSEYERGNDYRQRFGQAG